MKVVYALNSDVGKGGTGTAALHDSQALHKAGLLQTLLCRSHEKSILPQDKVKDIFPGGRQVSRAISALSYYGGGVFPSQYANDALFDRACGKYVKDCDIFAAWNTPIRSEKIAQHHNALAIKHAGSSHPLTRMAIAKAEEKRRHIKMPLSTLSFKREQKEFAIADHMVVPSNFIKQSYVEHGIDGKRVHVVPHGVDIDRFTPTEMPDGKFTALFVGQIQHRKGVLDLLDAWEQAALPDARLVFGGVVQPELKKIVAAYQKELKNIELPGFIDPAVWLKKSHLFAFPSLEEGFALVVTEAMAAGRPALVTENVGAKDFVKKDNGFVVEAGDIAAIAKSLRYAYDNRQQLETMGRNARRAVEGWSWNEAGELLVKTYKQCAKR